MLKRTSGEYKAEILRALALYASYIVLSIILSGLFVLLCSGFMKSLHIPREPVYAISTLGIILPVYSLGRAFELYDLGARERFISHANGKYSLIADIKITFSDPILLFKTVVQIAVTVLLAFILPYEIGYGYLIGSVRGFLAFSETELYFLKSAVVCPMLAVILMLAKTSAHKWWIVARTAERERMDTLKNPILRLWLEILKIAGIYTVSFCTLPTVIMLLVSTILMLGLFAVQPWMLPVIAVVIIVPIFARKTATLIRRRRFWKKFIRTVKSCGYTLSDVKSPIMSSVRELDGPTFILDTGAKKYAVKLLSSSRRRKPAFINPEGYFTVKNTVSFLKITLFHIMKDIEYGFESEHDKIAVFSPMPRRVFINWGRTDTAFDDGDGGTLPTIVTVRAAAMSGGRSQSIGVHGPGYKSDVDRGIIKPFETGDRIGGVKFFSPRGFISAVDNDCLDR